MVLKKNIASLSDEDLITRYKESEDNTYIGELYKKYTHVVLGVCMKYLRDREEAKDAVMQIFEKLISDLKKHEVSNFRGWLHMVAKNHCLMKLRNKTQMLDIDQIIERSDNVVEFHHDLHPT